MSLRARILLLVLAASLLPVLALLWLLLGWGQVMPASKASAAPSAARAF